MDGPLVNTTLKTIECLLVLFHINFCKQTILKYDKFQIFLSSQKNDIFRTFQNVDHFLKHLTPPFLTILDLHLINISRQNFFAIDSHKMLFRHLVCFYNCQNIFD